MALPELSYFTRVRICRGCVEGMQTKQKQEKENELKRKKTSLLLSAISNEFPRSTLKNSLAIQSDKTGGQIAGRGMVASS
jgi:hypothetical protein